MMTRGLGSIVVNSRCWFKWVAVWGVLMSLTTFLFGQTLQMVQVTSLKTRAPQGSRVPMLFLQMQALGGPATFGSITIFNNGSNPFGSGVQRISIYRDVVGQGVPNQYDEGIDTEVSGYTFISSGQSSSFTLSLLNETIPSNNLRGYFIVYDIPELAQIGSNVSAVINSFSSPDSVTMSFPSPPPGVATISGFTAVNIVAHDTLPSPIVLPGEQNVAALLAQLKPGQEDINRQGFKLTVNIGNPLFLTNSGGQNGIVRARLYKANLPSTVVFSKSSAESGSSVFQLISSVVSGEFISSRSVTFQANPGTTILIQQDVTANFFVTFDYGSGIVVTTNTTLSPQVTELVGLGALSLLPFRLFSPQPVTPVPIAVAGLSYVESEIRPLFDSSTNYGRRSVIPMMKIELQANYIPITIATWNILNQGTVPFRVSNADPKNIQKIEIYQDTNKTRAFEMNADTKVSETILGNGLNQVDGALVTFNISGPITIPKFEPNSLSYSTSGATQFYVVYTVGDHVMANQLSSFGSGVFAMSRISNILGSAVRSGQVIALSLSGQLPATPTPEAKVMMVDALNVILTAVTSLVPTKTIQGQVQVPMIGIKLDSSGSYANTRLTLKNESESFSPTSEGVNRVWVYRDNDRNNLIDGFDTLLGGVDYPSNRLSVVIPNLPISTGENNWIVLYNIGYTTPITNPGVSNTIRVQVASVNSEEVFKFGGQQTPYPDTAISTRVESNRVNVSKVGIIQPNQAILTQFTVGVSINNLTASSVVVRKIEPRFYFSTISGSDISYEFSVVTTNVFPLTLAPNQSRGVTFLVTHSNRVSDGTALVDAFLEYEVDDSIYPTFPLASQKGLVQLVRYLSPAGWVPISSDTPRINIAKAPQYAWSWPGYVSTVWVDTNGAPQMFTNGDSITKQSSLRIRFINNGANINEASIVVKLNGNPLSKSIQLAGLANYDAASTRPLSASQYRYYPGTGELRIDDLGIQSGVLTVSLTDNQGNPLPDLRLDYRIESVVALTNPLFFPNPYTRGKGIPLKLGFQITQPSSVKVYIYNALGRKVWESTTVFSTIGYQEITFPTNSELMVSGLFLCKVVATDAAGNRSMGSTKLAVY